RALPGRDGAVAPPLRLLPTLVGESTLATAGPEGSAVGLEVSVVECGAPTTAPRAPAGLPFAVEEHRLEVVQLDLFEASPHLLVLGDAGCGKSSLLRLVANGLAARHPPDEVALVIVDPRRGLLDLTALPNLVGYAYSTTTVTQAVDQLRREFEERSAGFELLPVPSMPALAPAGAEPLVPGGPNASLALVQAPNQLGPLMGPHHVVLVDDYDLLPGAGGSPLLPLLDLLGLGRELGFHLVLTRRVAGAARAAFEPVVQRLRELGGSGLVMSGDPGEGPLLGGQRAAALPAGRGFLVRPPAPPTLVQVAYRPPPATSRPAGGRSAWGG
ncbi:MAG: FtsK/SpoIIIE domain-containing protein, partial [Actinomycetota bacterium]